MTTYVSKMMVVSVLLVGVSGRTNAMWRSGLRGLASRVSRLGASSVRFSRSFSSKTPKNSNGVPKDISGEVKSALDKSFNDLGKSLRLANRELEACNRDLEACSRSLDSCNRSIDNCNRWLNGGLISVLAYCTYELCQYDRPTSEKELETFSSDIGPESGLGLE